MLHFIHYGKREHVEQFFENGSIQIGTLRSYDTHSFGDMVGDDGEGTSEEYITDDNAVLLADKMELPTSIFGLPLFNAPGVSGGVYIKRNISFNYAIYCMSTILHRDLCVDFNAEYDAAIYIDRPFPFLQEITDSFRLAGLSESPVQFQHVVNVHYKSRYIDYGTEVFEAAIKPERYRHQSEVRAIWSAGTNPPPFFRFKSIEAVRCCRKILLKDMPSYKPGTVTLDEAHQHLLDAIKKSAT